MCRYNQPHIKKPTADQTHTHIDIGVCVCAMAEEIQIIK